LRSILNQACWFDNDLFYLLFILSLFTYIERFVFSTLLCTYLHSTITICFIMEKQKIFGIFDHTFLNPEENLKFEETFLGTIDDMKLDVTLLRFWESTSYFVVLGRSNKSNTETFEALCNKNGIPVLTRCSGGGTVLQGPGCLNYAFIKTFDNYTSDITKTNDFVMSTIKTGFLNAGLNVEVNGFTDLTIGNKKFSGNAQKRKRQTLLFHGTILYNFDLNKISEYLQYPSKSPDYRQNRDHSDFLTNIDMAPVMIKKTISDAFGLSTHYDLDTLLTYKLS
jgi:lipoate---protein ligase